MNPEDLNKNKKLKTIDQPSDVVDVTIDDLNEDCLTYIFEFLSIKEKLKIESVNKRWNRVSKQSWSNIKFFSEDIVIPRNSVFLSDRQLESKKTVLTDACINILKKSHPYLNGLTLESYNIKKYFEYERFLKEVPKYFQNVTYIYLIDSSNIFKNKFLNSMFVKMKNLNNVVFNSLYVKGNCFSKLNVDKITRIAILNCRFEKSFFDFLSKLKNLNHIQLFEDLKMVNKIFDTLSRSECEKLGDIYIHYTDGRTNPFNYPMFLSKQKMLRNLKLTCVKIDDQLMRNLPESLEELKIDYSFYFSHRGSSEILLKYLNRLQNLKSLKVELIDFTNDFLDKLTNSINKNIKSIDLNFSNIHYTGEPINALSKLKNLESFSYHDYDREGENQILLINNILKDLLECKNLKNVKLWENRGYSSEIIKQFYSKPNFKSLEFTGELIHNR